MKIKNIREIFEDYLFTSGVTKISIAKKLKLSQQNFQKKTANNKYDTDFIIQISKALGHDFFADLSNELCKTDEMQNNLVNKLRQSSTPNINQNNGDRILADITEKRILNLEKQITDNAKDKKLIKKQIDAQNELLKDVLANYANDKKNNDLENATISRKAKLVK